MGTGAHTESRLLQAPEALRSVPSPGPAKLTFMAATATTFSGPECCCGLHTHLPGATLASLQCVLCHLSPASSPCMTSGCFLLLPWSEPLTQPSSGISLSGFLKLPLLRSPSHTLFPLSGIPFPVAPVFELSCACPAPSGSPFLSFKLRSMHVLFVCVEYVISVCLSPTTPTTTTL